MIQLRSLLQSIRMGFFLQRFIMFIGLRPRHKKLLQLAQHLFGTIVLQARQKEFYRDWGIRDDKDGRYEMLSLHLFLILERLRNEPCENTDDDITIIGEFLAEVAVTDLENNLREMGVGDLGVGRRVQKMTKRHYARMQMYRTLFIAETTEQTDATITQTLIKYVYSDEKGVAPIEANTHALHLLKYIRDNVQLLAQQPVEELFKQPNFSLSKG